MDTAGANTVIASITRAKVLVFVVFVLGMLTGALLDNVYETRVKGDSDVSPAKRSQLEMNRMYDLLELTPEQRQQFQRIAEESRPDFQKLFEENRRLLEPNQRKFEELQEQTRTKVRAILTDEQKKKYDEYNEQRKRTRRPPPLPRKD
jgi:Spy/CpxP family protein refolding chaperone